MGKKKFYAVLEGRLPGIYNSWEDCRAQTEGFPGAIFKGFSTEKEALEFLNPEKKENKIPQDTAVAYVDGSFSPDKNAFSFGALIFYKDEAYKFKKAYFDSPLASMRNVAGEIKGAEFVMHYAAVNKIKKLIIYYDYQGIEKWCTGEWKAQTDGTKQYRNTYAEYSKSVEISFVKVKGHSNNKYNDLVDSLAKSALGIE